MCTSRRLAPAKGLPLLAVLLFVASSCSTGGSEAPSNSPGIEATGAFERTQALVMAMADEYIAALGESVYVLTKREDLSPEGRALAHSFLRNGVGASIDIGAGANPPVDMLDLLVLASLQTWSFEAQWMPRGIGEAGAPALERLKRAESDLWSTARQTLSDEQLATLRSLIDSWISENPDRIVVSLVRFEEFADARRTSSTAIRREASGLLREVSEVAGAIDEARLLAERVLWFAGRYPYLVGEQAELTAYRMAAQPEGKDLLELVGSLNALASVLNERAGTIEQTLEAQQSAFFARVAAERAETVSQAERSLGTVLQKSLEEAARQIHEERAATVEQVFERLALERDTILDELDVRAADAGGLARDLRDTVAATQALATELAGTINAVDRVVARFDPDEAGTHERLRFEDVQAIATETAHAAEQLTRVLELTNDLVQSGAVDQRIARITAPANEVVDRVFWRGAALIGLLVAGLALVKLLPGRNSLPGVARG